MASCRQRSRISAVASALEVIRRRELTPGYDLVVSGGAYAPDTKIESINPIVDMSFDHYELTPQHPPLFPPPCVPLGHCVVVFGVAAALIGYYPMVLVGGPYSIMVLPQGPMLQEFNWALVRI
ncbi:hypothetical protein CYMTET_27760 [Cymbomonas tetramitiformis]|uniref:Uncharacterized protein n=1 Tax=Cymbomonas tetramitiformis TaxID=36881 RepID=A0AAE0KWM1_9CHLO|nr:hypothetical protein CYMTET_27760 [Cymbomonas tetramitiformis]